MTSFVVLPPQDGRQLLAAGRFASCCRGVVPEASATYNSAVPANAEKSASLVFDIENNPKSNDRRCRFRVIQVIRLQSYHDRVTPKRGHLDRVGRP
jgi:hypothetical protein